MLNKMNKRMENVAKGKMQKVHGGVTDMVQECSGGTQCLPSKQLRPLVRVESKICCTSATLKHDTVTEKPRADETGGDAIDTGVSAGVTECSGGTHCLPSKQLSPSRVLVESKICCTQSTLEHDAMAMVKPFPYELVYRARLETVRRWTPLTKQPGQHDNGCCLIASVVNLVTNQYQKQLLLGWTEEDAELDVESIEAYAHFQQFFRDAEAKAKADGKNVTPGWQYLSKGIREWLKHLQEIGILETFHMQPVDTFRMDASRLLDAKTYGRVHGPTGGYVMSGYQGFQKKRGEKKEPPLVNRELMQRIVRPHGFWGGATTCTTADLKSQWADPKWKKSSLVVTNQGTIEPLAYYHLSNAQETLRAEARRIACTFAEDGKEPSELAIRAHRECLVEQAKKGWVSRMLVLSGRNKQQTVPIYDEVTREKVGIKKISAETKLAEVQGEKALKKRVRTMVHKGGEEGKTAGKQAIAHFQKMKKKTAKLFQKNADSVGLTAHAICLLPNQRANEMVLLDPGKNAAKLLSSVDSVQSAVELMGSMMDYWQVLEIAFTFASRYQMQCTAKKGPVTHAEWEEALGDGSTEVEVVRAKWRGEEHIDGAAEAVEDVPEDDEEYCRVYAEINDSEDSDEETVEEERETKRRKTE